MTTILSYSTSTIVIIIAYLINLKKNLQLTFTYYYGTIIYSKSNYKVRGIMKKILNYYREIIIAVLLIIVIALTITLIVPPIQRALNKVSYYGTYDVVKNTKKDNFDYQNKQLAESGALVDGEERIVFFGDSITEIAPFNDMYPYGSVQPDGVYNRGISGDTALSMKDRISNVSDLKPSTVIILIGTNDINYGANSEQITGYLSEVITLLQADSIADNFEMDIYIQSVMPVNEAGSDTFGGITRNDKIMELNAQYEELCIEKNVAFIDTYNDFTDDKGDLKVEYTYDGLHPNSVGYYKMREVLERDIFSKAK